MYMYIHVYVYKWNNIWDDDETIGQLSSRVVGTCISFLFLRQTRATKSYLGGRAANSSGLLALVRWKHDEDFASMRSFSIAFDRSATIQLHLSNSGHLPVISIMTRLQFSEMMALNIMEQPFQYVSMHFAV